MVRRKKEKKELEQTKGSFRITGKVSRVIDDPNASRPSWKEGEGKDTSSRAGDPYRSLSFSVITSQEGNVKNEVPVEMFGFEEDYMGAWDSKKQKYRRVDLGDIDNLGEDESLMGIRVGLLEKDEDGEYITELIDEETGKVALDDKGKPKNPREHIVAETLPTYEAMLAIYENIENGDDIYVSGKIEHSEYVNQKGDVQKQTRYKIEGIGTPKRVIDFGDEKFVEKAYFEDELVYIDSELDTENNALIINAKAIIYLNKDQNKVVDTVYRIDYSGDFEEGVNEEDKLEDMAKAIKKNAKLGDLFRVWGHITISPRLITEVSNSMSKFGVKKGKPQQSMGSIQRYLDIQGLDEGSEQRPKDFHVEGMYSEDDLFVEDTEEKEAPEERFNRRTERKAGTGRRKPAVDENDNDPIDIDDSDLPF